MRKCNVPQYAKAIDGSQILVKPPLLNHTGWYPVLIQAVVEAVYLMPEFLLIPKFKKQQLMERF